MESKKYKHYVAIISLMMLTGLVLIMQKDVPASGKAGIGSKLPAKVGNYTGRSRLFCQNEVCMRSFLLSILEGSRICPACNGELDEITLGEKRILPADTVIEKKEYVSVAGSPVAVSIILSGKEQKSIHRPQQCLPAQGHVIEGSQVISVPLKGRPALDVMLLDLRKAGTTLDGRRYRYLSSYAYWFVGTDRETPYHLQRLFWMSSDRVFRNINHRWAYIAIATQRRENSEEHIDRIRDFIAELYPLIIPTKE